MTDGYEPDVKSSVVPDFLKKAEGGQVKLIGDRGPEIFTPNKTKDPIDAERGLFEVLACLGMNLNDASLCDTPKRFIKYLLEFMQGELDIEKVLGKGFEHGSSDTMVTQSNIPFRMICEHHLLPAIGKASIGYLPNGRVVGLSKLTRLVDAVGTEKPSLQEAICDRIADLLYKTIDAKGVIVAIYAEHGCMACRGVNSPGVITSTTSIRGLYLTVPAARDEFYNTIGMSERIK